MTFRILIIAITIISFVACSKSNPLKKGETVIYGTVEGFSTGSLRLVKFTDIQNNITNTGSVIKIDENGKFNFKIHNESPEMYHLIFENEIKRGYWTPIKFFNDKDSILFKLNSDKNNIINGGELNKKFNDYNTKIKRYFEPKIDDTVTKKTQKEILTEFINHRYTYINEKKSEFSYYLLMEDILYNSNNPILNTELIKNYAEDYKIKYPKHNYSKIIDHKVLAFANLEVGDMYIPFSAKDITKTKIDVSKIVTKNRITIIDLWPPWCAPCIGKSKKLIPFYEKYNDLNLEVVGVVGRINSYKKYEQAHEKFKYPWKVLSEVNNENNIWDSYRLKTEPGGIFVVDNKGIILSKNPTTNELKNIISKQLNKVAL